MSDFTPIVSIGMPVYNGASTLRSAINSLLGQSFQKFEIIISDNASTDDTASICQQYALDDKRIRYFRQSSNLGGVANFKFVFDQATAPYFMWSGSDDVRSSDFIQVNQEFLANNSDYVASTSPNGFENWAVDHPLVDFALNGDEFTRYTQFFKNSFTSHGVFYSLFRTEVLRGCGSLRLIFPGFDWLGFDWAVILFLASKGRINRSQEGSTTFGVSGSSSSLAIYKKYNTRPIEWWFPFFRLSQFTIKLVTALPMKQKVHVWRHLARINFVANVDPIRGYFFNKIHWAYLKCVKPILQKIGLGN